MDHCSFPFLRTAIIFNTRKKEEKSPGMDLLFCLATSEQVITSANHAGSFQLSMSVIKKGEDKNANMKFSNAFMPKK